MNRNAIPEREQPPYEAVSRSGRLKKTDKNIRYMKKLFLILCLAPFIFAGCTDNDKYDGNSGSGDYSGTDNVMLVQYGKLLQSMIGIEDPVTLTLDAFKTGGYGSQCTVTFSVNEALLDAYNAAEGTSLQMLPEEYYTTGGEKQFQLGLKQYHASLDIGYDPADILELYAGAFGTETYAIPVGISVSGNDVGKDDERSSAIIVFRIQEPIITIEQKTFAPLTVIKGETDVAEYSFNAKMNFVGNADRALVFESDTDALAAEVEEYNELNETNYALLPARAYSFTSSKIPAGSDTGEIVLAIDKNDVDFNGLYLLPIILTDNGGEIVIEGNAKLYLKVTAAQLLDRTGWSVAASSTDADNVASVKAIDGEVATYWHTMFKKGGLIIDTDRIFQITLPETVNLIGVGFAQNGTQVAAWEMYASTEGSDADKLIEARTVETWSSIGAVSEWGTDWKHIGDVEGASIVSLALPSPVEAKYVRVKVKAMKNASDNTAGIHEINLYGWTD